MFRQSQDVSVFLFDGDFDSNASIGDVPEIELPICDLMPVIINTHGGISV